MTDNRVLELLSQGGFSNKEADILSQLLKAPYLAAGTLANRTKIKRPTVYAVLNNLVSQGLVNRVVRGGKTYFEIIPYAAFCEVIDDRAKRDYETKSDAAKHLKDLVSSMMPALPSKVGGYTITTLDNEELVMKALQKVLEEGDFCCFYNPQVVLVGMAKDLVEQIFIANAETQPSIREIVVQGPKVDWYVRQTKRNPNHRLKFIPSDTDIMLDMFVTKESVLLISYTDGAQHAISIEQNEFVRSMQAVFELMWSML